MLRFKEVMVILLLALNELKMASGVYLLTNVHCESYNKSIAEFKYCRLKAIKRDMTVFNMNMMMKIPANNIFLNVQVLKKASGYKPFPMNYTIDCCEYVKKHNHPFFNFIYSQFKKFSNINHTCPYEGEQIIDGFYPNVPASPIPWPVGEYLLKLTWFVSSLRAFSTDVYFKTPDF